MRIVRYPEREVWKRILERPHTDISALNGVVDGILEDVRNNGDEAVRRCEMRFDGVSLQSLAVTDGEIENAVRSVDERGYRTRSFQYREIPYGAAHDRS